MIRIPPANVLVVEITENGDPFVMMTARCTAGPIDLGEVDSTNIRRFGVEVARLSEEQKELGQYRQAAPWAHRINRRPPRWHRGGASATLAGSTKNTAGQKSGDSMGLISL